MNNMKLYQYWVKSFYSCCFLKVCELLLFRENKTKLVYFRFLWVSITFLDKRRLSKFCLCEVKLTFYLYIFILISRYIYLFWNRVLALVTVLPIFVADTLIIFGYYFEAPLNIFYCIVSAKNNYEKKFAQSYFKQYDLKSLPVSLDVFFSISFYL